LLKQRIENELKYYLRCHFVGNVLPMTSAMSDAKNPENAKNQKLKQLLK